MHGYRDMTFCSLSIDSAGARRCTHGACPRYASQAVWKGAEEMGLGVALGDMKTPECGYRPLGLCPHDGGTCHHRCGDPLTDCVREEGGMILSTPHPGFPLPGHEPKTTEEPS